MEKEKLLVQYLNTHAFITCSDAESIGISRSYIYKLEKKGIIENQKNGLFSLAHTQAFSEFDSIIEATKRVPTGIVSLFSALTVHKITTQLPHEVWLTVPQGGWQPQIDYPPIHYTTAVTSVYEYGIQELKVGNDSIKVYSPAKTVADCFKNRNKIGIDVAIEALREAWRSKKITMDELVEACKVCRVLSVIRPYMEAIV